MRVSYLALAAALAVPSAVSAAEVVNVPAFRGIELRDGGQVVVRRGTIQRVTIVEGSSQFVSFSVRDGKLTIVTCPNHSHCSMHQRVKVEITTPSIEALAVSDGGIVRTEGAFPLQNHLAAAVDDGGIVDVRSLPATNVAAAVHSGGRVLVTARGSLAASVSSGGAITFWGEPSSVAKSIQDGGVISRGAMADARRPVSDMAPRPPAPPQAVPAVPPVPDVDDADNGDADVDVEAYGDNDEDDE